MIDCLRRRRSSLAAVVQRISPDAQLRLHPQAPIGRVQRLTALRLLTPGADESAVTVQFRDRTNGHGTRRQGRHLDAWPIPEKPGQYWLDLNQAYNPGCAFSKHLDCPAGFPKNRLDLSVRMGERTPGHE